MVRDNNDRDIRDASRKRRGRWLRVALVFVIGAGAGLAALAWLAWGIERAPDEQAEIRGVHGVVIRGSLHTPTGTPRGYFVLCPGHLKPGRNHLLYRDLASELSRAHVVLTLDMPGYGDSPPRPNNVVETLDFSDGVVAAVNHLSTRFGCRARDVVLIGHSLGAPQVILAGRQLESERVFALGWGLPERVILATPQRRAVFAQQMREYTGMELDTDKIEEAADPIRTERVLHDCRIANLVFVYGQEEDSARTEVEQAVARHLVAPDSKCRVTFESVPAADHMYGTALPWGLRRLCSALGWNPSHATVVDLADRILRIAGQQTGES
ncbi:MAG: alpha/beta fold hydrolase [Planctomycetota bacterium]|jgi:pimeloyl-ACP methyl ester carboxylesterase